MPQDQWHSSLAVRKSFTRISDHLEKSNQFGVVLDIFFIGFPHVYIYIYLGKLERPHCDLTEIMANKGNHHQMALIQAREKIKFTLIYPYIYNYICKIYTRGYIIGMYLTLRPPQ